MATHNDLGKQGEALARQYLEQHGYAILETNWRLGRSEVDIIAYIDCTIVFVEVKTRSSLMYGTPEEKVDKNKRRTYVRMANAYVLNNNKSEEVRFDIISVVVENGTHKITHIPNAYNAIALYL
ncbi:MAG: YraN family protein [Bacteroidales bacterium]|nr:YraN family protein [Candidatus Colimorpha onthohippi]